MREKVDMKSQAQGFAESRLPQFTESQSLLVANTSGTFMIRPTKRYTTLYM